MPGTQWASSAAPASSFAGSSWQTVCFDEGNISSIKIAMSFKDEMRCALLAQPKDVNVQEKAMLEVVSTEETLRIVGETLLEKNALLGARTFERISMRSEVGSAASRPVAV